MSDIDHTSPGFDLSSHWTLDPAIRFLNHGSFGATPSRVLHEQQEIRARMEREPVDFFVRKLPAALDRARCELAEFVGAEPANLAFVPNTTTGVNAVLRSLELEPGDEILVTDHGYPACNNAVDFVADRAGAKVVVAEVPFPIASADEVVDAVLDEVTDNTRLALIDHVTSATALIFPVEQIIEALSERGVDTLIDGAHAPGMLPLELESLGATYY
ncbi:MAG: aminotransferase class V-fold PLP-dependent enzyme, partial [Persicimonas sp.]